MNGASELCGCGAGPADWLTTSDEVAKGRARAAIAVSLLAILFGLLMLFSLVRYYFSDAQEPVSLSAGLLLGLGGIAFGLKILTVRPARRQTLVCGRCGATRTRVVPDERTRHKLLEW